MYAKPGRNAGPSGVVRGGGRYHAREGDLTTAQNEDWSTATGILRFGVQQYISFFSYIEERIKVVQWLNHF
jgi:hypothetical protein